MNFIFNLSSTHLVHQQSSRVNYQIEFRIIHELGWVIVNLRFRWPSGKIRLILLRGVEFNIHRQHFRFCEVYFFLKFDIRLKNRLIWDGQSQILWNIIQKVWSGSPWVEFSGSWFNHRPGWFTLVFTGLIANLVCWLEQTLTLPIPSWIGF
jgi:hypothetical protein